MRLLLNEIDPSTGAGAAVDRETLTRLYAYPEGRPWLRSNMVTTLDGAATGDDGRTGSINTSADRDVFALLRALADVILVGAGTARAERYGRPDPVAEDLAGVRTGRPPAPALAVVSRSGRVPERLVDVASDASGEVVLATCAGAGSSAIDEARRELGEGNVLVVGDAEVDLPALIQALAARGWSRILCEGGPHLLHDLVAADLVDEHCLTIVPRMVAGVHPRILVGDPVYRDAVPRLLLESDGTLLGRWVLTPDRGA